MLWADANMEQIVRQLFPDAPEKFEIETKWYTVLNYDDNTTHRVDMTVHAILSIPTVQEIRFGDREPIRTEGWPNIIFNQTLYLYFHQQILSIGDAIKQIREHQAARSEGITWCIVSADDRYADLLERQKLRFIKAPPEAAQQ